MERKKLSDQINANTDELTRLLSPLSQSEINVIPFEGSWTAGQLAKHVIISNSGFAKMLNGPAGNRHGKPDEMVGRIKADFLNFNTKMKSPEFVVPKKINYYKEDLLSSLAALNNQLNQSVQSLDLSKTCLAFELPVYGALTRLEAICFVIYHTQRHIHQLKNIISRLKERSDV